MKPFVILGLFLCSLLLLWVLAKSERILMDTEILVETLLVGLFLSLHIAGFRWARWVASILLSLLLVIAITTALEGFGFGFVIVAVLYAGVIGFLFFKPRAASNVGGGYADPVLDWPSSAASTAPVNGFEVGQEVYKYPLLVKRYQSLMIDFLLVALIIIFATVVLGESPARHAVMVSIGVFFALVYEPVLTTYGATVGQYVMGIRVRSAKDPKQRINLLQAYIRLIVKVILGWLSFLTINFNPKHRAIHDMAGSSVMVRIR